MGFLQQDLKVFRLLAGYKSPDIFIGRERSVQVKTAKPCEGEPPRQKPRGRQKANRCRSRFKWSNPFQSGQVFSYRKCLSLSRKYLKVLQGSSLEKWVHGDAGVVFAIIGNSAKFLVSSGISRMQKPQIYKKWGFIIQPWQSPQALPLV